MPLRNLFKRSEPSEVSLSTTTGDRGFSNASVAGAQPIDEPEPAEYQLSEIDDSGVFLPPSPDHSKPSFWHTKSNSSFSSNHRSNLSDHEPFHMSRESFDSFRRSFDISARSPVISVHEPDARRSLDSSLLLSSPRRSVSDQHPAPDWPEDEELQDVKLADDQQKQAPAPASRRRGLFARFAESSERPLPAEAKERELGIKPSHSFQLFSGRKRGQSGQGDELRSLGETGTPAIRVGGE